MQCVGPGASVAPRPHHAQAWSPVVYIHIYSSTCSCKTILLTLRICTHDGFCGLLNLLSITEAGALMLCKVEAMNHAFIGPHVASRCSA